MNFFGKNPVILYVRQLVIFLLLIPLSPGNALDFDLSAEYENFSDLNLRLIAENAAVKAMLQMHQREKKSNYYCLGYSSSFLNFGPLELNGLYHFLYSPLDYNLSASKEIDEYSDLDIDFDLAKNSLFGFSFAPLKRIFQLSGFYKWNQAFGAGILMPLIRNEKIQLEFLNFLIEAPFVEKDDWYYSRKKRFFDRAWHSACRFFMEIEDFQLALQYLINLKKTEIPGHGFQFSCQYKNKNIEVGMAGGLATKKACNLFLKRLDNQISLDTILKARIIKVKKMTSDVRFRVSAEREFPEAIPGAYYKHNLNTEAKIYFDFKKCSLQQGFCGKWEKENTLDFDFDIKNRINLDFDFLKNDFYLDFNEENLRIKNQLQWDCSKKLTLGFSSSLRLSYEGQKKISTYIESCFEEQKGNCDLELSFRCGMDELDLLLIKYSEEILKKLFIRFKLNYQFSLPNRSFK